MIGIIVFFIVTFINISISKASNYENPIIVQETYGYTQELEKIVLNKTISEKKYILKNKKISFTNITINENETLDILSKKYKINKESIILCNNLKNEQTKKGQVLKIPNQDGRLIKIKNNDNLYKIANKFGVSIYDIVDTNGLKNDKLISESYLFIPKALMTKSEKLNFYSKPEKTNTRTIIWPLKGKISSYYGFRLDPFTLTYDFHTGLDIKKDLGSPVKAPIDGSVVFVGWSNVYGNMIILKHDNDIYTMYGHLNKINVKIGDSLKQGDIFCEVGNTGRSTGSHLHFEIRKKEKTIDPHKILIGGKID